MRNRAIFSFAGLGFTVAVVAACAVGGSSGGTNINDAGSWAYEGCKRGLLERVQRDHPQAKAVEIVGHVTETKTSDSKSTLSGEGKFPKDGDNFHFTFTCEVNRDNKTIQTVKYDKQ